MRVLIVATAGESLYKFRGNLIREWVKRGCEVVCISIEPSEEMSPIVQELGASYVQVPGNRTGTSIIDGFEMIKKYENAFRSIQPDICFLYMSKPVAFGGIAAIRSGIKRIVVYQTGLEIAFYSGGIKNLFIRKVLKTLYRYVQSHCETVFFMNHEDERKMIEWGLVKQSQVCYVDGSGVNLDYFQKKDMPSMPVVLMVARLVWSKGIREYIEAAKIVKTENKNVRFMLVGGLDENSEALTKDELKELIDSGLIEYMGYQNDVRPYLEECSIFVLPSYHEGKGTAILEAQAVGRPIITTTAPGCCETVIDGYNGFLVPAKDAQSLAKRIAQLSSDKELRDRMAENAYQHAVKTFDQKIICDIMCNRMRIYKDDAKKTY